MKLSDIVRIMTDQMVTAFFRDTSVKQMPVFCWCNSGEEAGVFLVLRGNYRRYFSGKMPLTSLFSRLNAANAAIFSVNNGFCG